MFHLRLLLALACFTSPAQDQPGEARSWKNVQYLGGAVGVRGKSITWDNQLTIALSGIRLELKGSPIFEIDPTRVTALTYRGHRRLSDFSNAALGAGLFGLAFSGVKSTDHVVAIEYVLPDGRSSGVLLRAHKKNYNAILAALHEVTGIRDDR